MSLNKISIRNFTILLGSTTTLLAAVILAPSLPGMADEFRNVPNAAILVRLSLTLPALLIAIGAPFTGILLDRWGRKPVILVALVLYGISGSAGLVLPTLAGVLVSRAVLGIAVAGLASGFTTLIADFFRGEALNRFMGYQAAFIGLGGVVFQFVAGVLADANWRYPFAIYLIGFVLLPLVFFSLKEPEIDSASTRRGQIKHPTPFLSKSMMAIYLFALVGMLTFFIFPVQIPFFLSLRSGASGTEIGLALSLQTLVSVFTAYFYQQIKTRLSYQGIFAIVFLALGISHLITSLSSEFVVMTMGMLVGGLGIGLLPPNLNVWVGEIAPPALRGRAFGGLTAAIFLGQFLTPILTQPIVDFINLEAVFSIAAGFSALMALFFIISLPRSNRESQKTIAVGNPD